MRSDNARAASFRRHRLDRRASRWYASADPLAALAGCETPPDCWLPDVCSIAQLQEWLMQNEWGIWLFLARCGKSARYFVRPLLRDPLIRSARRGWVNPRPFPNDCQLLLLLTLLCPEHRLENIDKQAWSALARVLLIMAQSAPIPNALLLDVEKREIVLNRQFAEDAISAWVDGDSQLA